MVLDSHYMLLMHLYGPSHLNGQSTRYWSYPAKYYRGLSTLRGQYGNGRMSALPRPICITRPVLHLKDAGITPVRLNAHIRADENLVDVDGQQ
jgi:hypothetical protein